MLFAVLRQPKSPRHAAREPFLAAREFAMQPARSGKSLWWPTRRIAATVVDL
jgi:hypothetical protein